MPCNGLIIAIDMKSVGRRNKDASASPSNIPTELGDVDLRIANRVSKFD